MKRLLFAMMFMVGCAAQPTTTVETCETEQRVLAIYCYNYHGGNEANNATFNGELLPKCKQWAKETAPGCPD
jgi:hypothetical protein